MTKLSGDGIVKSSTPASVQVDLSNTTEAP